MRYTNMLYIQQCLERRLETGRLLGEDPEHSTDDKIRGTIRSTVPKQTKKRAGAECASIL